MGGTMKLTLLLADSADVVNGKLYVMGGAWTITDAVCKRSAIAIIVEVPWNEANVVHKLKLELVTEDGQNVKRSDGQSYETGVEFEVGRPAGAKPGVPFVVPLAVNLQNLALRPNSRYLWRCAIDGKTDETWEVSFSTRPSTTTRA